MKTESDSSSLARLDEAYYYIISRVKTKPYTALILGSGLGSFANALTVDYELDASDIPGYPTSTVEGHAGKLLFGRIRSLGRSSKPLLVFQGRVHYYEAGSIPSVVFPVQLAHKLSAQTLIVTNAAGGINPKFYAGQLMIIKDIISLTFLGLAAIPSSKSGYAYFSPTLQDKLRKAARKNAIDLAEGTYCWLRGPTYETAAEIRMLAKLGADAVGMSTVPEIVKARRLGMNVLGISLISNLATGLAKQKLSHEEVNETANRVKKSFTKLMTDLVLSL